MTPTNTRWPAVLAIALQWACAGETPVVLDAKIEFAPPSVDFGAIVPGMQSAVELRIQNKGQATLQIGSVKITDDERGAFQVENVPTEILPGAAGTMLVRYTAAGAAATDTAALIVSSNAKEAPEASVALVAATLAPTCDDGVKNGAETDRDCGGGCEGCPAGGRCGTIDDCASSVTCLAGVCTACGEAVACRPGQLCKNGACEGCATAADCNAGQACQAGLCTDCPNEGEPIDITRDPRHCGACGNECAAPLHAAAACKKSACTRAPCEAGYFDLDGPTTVGCEAQCAGTRCTTPSGVVTLSDPPLPEAGLAFQGQAAGGSVADSIQTSARFSNVGTTAQSTPPAEQTQAGGGWKNLGGFGSQFGR